MKWRCGTPSANRGFSENLLRVTTYYVNCLYMLTACNHQSVLVFIYCICSFLAERCNCIASSAIAIRCRLSVCLKRRKKDSDTNGMYGRRSRFNVKVGVWRKKSGKHKKILGLTRQCLYIITGNNSSNDSSESEHNTILQTSPYYQHLTFYTQAE